MGQLVVVFLIRFGLPIWLLSYSLPHLKGQENKIKSQHDTCIIEGMVFKLSTKGGPQKLTATIKNGHIKVFDNNSNSYRVIRYVFSMSPYVRIASVVRNFGSLVSYPVVLDLKKSSKGDKFYFENIVIANSSKEILNNEVKPLVLERIE